jgi:hypothetical protein
VKHRAPAAQLEASTSTGLRTGYATASTSPSQCQIPSATRPQSSRVDAGTLIAPNQQASSALSGNSITSEGKAPPHLRIASRSKEPRVTVSSPRAASPSVDTPSSLPPHKRGASPLVNPFGPVPPHIRDASQRRGADSVPPHQRTTSSTATGSDLCPPSRHSASQPKDTVATASPQQQAASPTPSAHLPDASSKESTSVARPLDFAQIERYTEENHGMTSSGRQLGLQTSRVDETLNQSPANTETNLPPATVYIEANVEVKMVEPKHGSTLDGPGRTFIYGLPNRETVIWELRWEDDSVIREDIRNIFCVWSTGSILTIRRSGGPDCKVRSAQIQVDGLSAAKEFVKVADTWRARLRQSSESVFPYTALSGQRGLGIDLSTIPPLDGTKSAEDSLPAESKATQPTSPKTRTSFRSDKEPAVNQRGDELDRMIRDVGEETALLSGRDGQSQHDEHAEHGSKKLVEAQSKVTKRTGAHVREAEAKANRQIEATDLAGEETRKKTEALANRQQEIGALKIAEADVKKCANEEGLHKTFKSRKAAEPLGILIDTSPPSPEPRRSSYVDDLESLVYEQSTLIPTPKKQIQISEGEPDIDSTIIKSDPSVKSKSSSNAAVATSPALVLMDSEGQQVAEATSTDERAINAVILKRTPVGVDLSRDGMAVLSKLDARDYRTISTVFDALLDSLGRSGMYKEGSLREFTAVQVVLIHLARRISFRTLDFEEQVKVAAVVFHNLDLLKHRSRVTYTQAQLIGLRCHAGPCPTSVALFMDVVESTKLRLTPTLTGSTVSAYTPRHGTSRTSLHYETSRNHGLLAPDIEEALRTPGRLISSSVTPPPDNTPFRNENLKENAVANCSVSDSHKKMGSTTVDDTINHADIRESDTVTKEAFSTDNVPTESFYEFSQTRGGVRVATSSQIVSSTPNTQVALANLTNHEVKPPLPPHLRGINRNLGSNGLGGSRWA